MGFLVDKEESALMWRGLMLNRAVQHFLEDVRWGDLDYLMIDMPPGTGDVQMGLARMLPRTEILIVTTPAASAQKVAVRAAGHGPQVVPAHRRRHREHERLRVRARRVVPAVRRGRRRGPGPRGRRPLLGSIPLEPAVALGGDEGQPIALGDGPAAEAFRALATRIVEEAVPPVEMAGCSARVLEAAVAALDAQDAALEGAHDEHGETRAMSSGSVGRRSFAVTSPASSSRPSPHACGTRACRRGDEPGGRPHRAGRRRQHPRHRARHPASRRPTGPGSTLDEARRVWLTVGVAVGDDDEPAFAPGEVQVLRFFAAGRELFGETAVLQACGSWAARSCRSPRPRWPSCAWPSRSPSSRPAAPTSTSWTATSASPG